MSRVALAAGAHGLLIEVAASEADRLQSKCDAEQGVPPEILTEIMAAAREVEVPAVSGRVLSTAGGTLESFQIDPTSSR